MPGVPYTYLIGWSKHNKWYYGVRFAKNCHPSELWIKYKTSSKYVDKFVKENGEPDIIQVRKKFNSKEKARLWEEKVLIKMDVLNNQDKWLNKNIHPAILYEVNPCLGKKMSEETKKKISDTRILRNIPSPTKGRKLTQEQKQHLRNINLGKKQSQETIKKKPSLFKNELNAKKYILLKNGIKTEITNLKKYCRLNSVCYDSLFNLVSGRRKNKIYHEYTLCLV